MTVKNHITKTVFFVLMIYAATIPLNISLRSYLLGGEKEPDIIQSIFGGMRELVGDWADMKAEEYYHHGLSFLKAAAYHEGHSVIAQDALGGHREEHHHEEEEAAPNDLFSKIFSAVKVNSDSHLTPSEEKEVLPWFYVEVMFNPHDIRGYVLGGYWLQRLGKYSESIAFLKDGEKNNPASAQILASIGWAYYERNISDKALLYLERARRLWLEGKYPNDVSGRSYMDSDRALTFELLGNIYEKMREYQKALQIYEELSNFAQYPNLVKKIDYLKNKISNSQ